jgi:hypothetical protein
VDRLIGNSIGHVNGFNYHPLQDFSLNPVKAIEPVKLDGRQRSPETS